MNRTTSLVSAIAFVLLFTLFAKSSYAQFTTGVSSTGYNSSTRQVTGSGSTIMDPYTYAWYQAYVQTNLYRVDTNQVVATADNYSTVGGNDRASSSVAVASAGPGITYRLESVHYLLPLNTSSCYPYRGDLYGYSRNIAGTYANQYTWYPPRRDPSYIADCVTGWLYLGKTFQTVQTPPVSLTITSPRVGGSLNGTTQNALLGADSTLQASADYPGGTFSWSFTGPYSVPDGVVNSSTVKVRSTDLGSITARANYTISGTTYSTSLTINSVLPTVRNIKVEMGRDLVAGASACYELPKQNKDAYILGCPPYSLGAHITGFADAPAPYISDPSQSGVKLVQVVSGYRKVLVGGNVYCATKRASETNVDSGWQLDKADPYDNDLSLVQWFWVSNSLEMDANDNPWHFLPGDTVEQNTEALHVDDQFWMYFVYFTDDPVNPTLQRQIGRVGWRWGGEVVFDSDYTPTWTIKSSNTPGGISYGEASGVTVNYRGNGLVQDNQWTTCTEGPPPITNPIDATRNFVRQQYLDILHREPETGGWNAWMSVITRCAFDTTCIHDRRNTVARGFLESPENFSGHPDLANPGTHTYNREYVRLCYTSFLGRDPDDGGWDDWTNFLDSNPGQYDTLVSGFINSWEYRHRFGPP